MDSTAILNTATDTVPSIMEAFPPVGVFVTSDGSYHLGLVSTSIQTITLPEGTPIPDSNGLELRQGILVELEVTPDGYVLCASGLDEDGYGYTYDEAYLDFITSIRDRYSVLKRREGRLSPEDSIILQRLKTLL